MTPRTLEPEQHSCLFCPDIHLRSHSRVLAADQGNHMMVEDSRPRLSGQRRAAVLHKRREPCTRPTKLHASPERSI